MSTERGVEEIATLAQRLLADIAELDVEEIALDAHLVEDLGIDSLQRLELMNALELELGVRIASERWIEAQTLAEAAGLLGDGERLCG